MLYIYISSRCNYVAIQVVDSSLFDSITFDYRPLSNEIYTLTSCNICDVVKDKNTSFTVVRQQNEPIKKRLKLLCWFF